MEASLIGMIRNSKVFLKTTALLVISTFLFVYYSPDALAAKQAIEQQQAKTAHIKGESDEERLANALQSIKEHVAKNKDKLAKRVEKEGSLLDKALNVIGLSGLEPENIAELTAMNDEVVHLDKKAMANFKAIEIKLKAKKLPDEILQRHYEAVEKYQTEFNKLQTNIRRLKGAKSLYDQEEATEALDEFLKTQQFKPEQQPFDPNNLPFKPAKPNPDNKPKTTVDKFVTAGLFDNPYQQYAALGDFTYGNLPGANNPAYLAETDEVVISNPIRDLAQTLEYDPVKIYHWVLNNIEWLPTWGSMQDANITLGSRRGNAYDISSLLIALMRASKIPARYVHGTIDVETEKFKNWAGGFTDINAATTFATSGRIPLVSLISGGVVQKIRMEHIWVEAAIDFEPSRGIINRDADTWTQLDSSFKQFEYIKGLDVAEITGLDGQNLPEALIQSGVINEVEGWISGINPNIVTDAQQEAGPVLENYIQNNLVDPQPSDIIGGRKIIDKAYPILPSSLQNEIVVIGARYAEIPSALQNRIQFALGKDFFGQPQNTTTIPWVKVNNHKVSLSFVPASPADEDALNSLLPDSEITDISQLPDNIPAYLIKMIPEIKIDGKVVASGNSLSLGANLDLGFKLLGPISGAQIFSKIVAGSYLSITTVGGSISLTQLTNAKASLESTKSILSSADPAQLSTLTRETLLGDIFHTGTLGYFSQYLAYGEALGQQRGVHHILMPSVGTYGYVPRVSYFFGMPLSVSGGAAVMDLVGIRFAAIDNNNDATKAKNYVINLGSIASALEHTVPEQMFSQSSNESEAVSAVKALSKANHQGQRIYRITKENMAGALPNIHLSSAAMNDIRNALDVGKEVITHTDPISISGWSGAGYIILDPETGAGAYKITGGFSGGFLLLVGAIVVIFLLLALFLVVLAALLFYLSLFLVTFAIIGVILFVVTFIEAIVGIIAGILFVWALNELGLSVAQILTAIGIVAGLIAIIGTVVTLPPALVIGFVVGLAVIIAELLNLLYEVLFEIILVNIVPRQLIGRKRLLACKEAKKIRGLSSYYVSDLYEQKGQTRLKPLAA